MNWWPFCKPKPKPKPIPQPEPQPCTDRDTAAILAAINQLSERVNKMTKSVDDLTAAVSRLETQNAANSAELKKIADELAAASASNDTAAIDALTARINAVSDSMAAADAAAEPAPAQPTT
jgi:methyl-accepting chemotaxis protein